ncbi:MAG TPA: hypothetical protein VHY31_23120 [Streptosporangiaceae bacterium]|nr:hypothetical protein [Streptosporangiaceae bacterium]
MTVQTQRGLIGCRLPDGDTAIQGSCGKKIPVRRPPDVKYISGRFLKTPDHRHATQFERIIRRLQRRLKACRPLTAARADYFS